MGKKNNEPTATVLEEKIYNVKGTTKLNLWDEGFDQSGTDLEFFGNISAAPLGKMRIQKVHYKYPNNLEFDNFKVDIFQASKEKDLNLYMSDRYYTKAKKAEYGLNCETAAFDMETKFGYDHFHTGTDGYYATLIQMKQYYGMILSFDLDGDLFNFDELEGRFLALFPKRKEGENTDTSEKKPVTVTNFVNKMPKKSELTKYQMEYIDKVYDGKMPRDKAGKEELILLGNLVGDKICVHFPDFNGTPAHEKTFEIADEGDMPNGKISIDVLAGNLSLWVLRGYKIDYLK